MLYACARVCMFVCACTCMHVCMCNLGASKRDSSFGEAASSLEPPGSPMSGEQIFLTPVLPATLSGHWNNCASRAYRSGTAPLGRTLSAVHPSCALRVSSLLWAL